MDLLDRAVHQMRVNPARVIVLLSGLAFAGSMLAQYGFGLEPCPLCLAARLTFLVLALVAAPLALCAGRPVAHRLGLLLTGALSLVGLGLVGYHIVLLAFGGASCSFVVPMTLGQIQDFLPSVLSPILDGQGTCTPKAGTIEFFVTSGFVALAFGLLETTAFLSAYGLFRSFRKTSI